MFPSDLLGQTSCPWMNAATASGILGEPVNATVIRANKTSEDATCDFAPQHSAANTSLHIAVITMSAPGPEFATYTRPCGSKPIPLQAIGNEAVECTQNSNATQSVEVIGRVRNRVFLVILRSADIPLVDELSKAKNVAEQVSEALY
jgi:hypothetical protein